MSATKARTVRFKGREFWLSDIDTGTVPPHQRLDFTFCELFDEDALPDESYAIVMDTGIWQHGVKIGDVTDLQDVESQP